MQPHADGFIGFKTAFDTCIPCRNNALGVKGVGELGTIGATPAVVNAVVDALASTGLGRSAERVQMPLTAEVGVARAARRLRAAGVRGGGVMPARCSRSMFGFSRPRSNC